MEDPCESGSQRFKQRPPTAGLLFSERNRHFVLRAGLRAHEGLWRQPKPASVTFPCRTAGTVDL